MPNSVSTRSSKLATGDRFDGDGNSIHNAILLALPARERDAVLAKLEFIKAPLRTVLNEMSSPIEHAYFINSGLASILNIMSDGKSVEVGLTGADGFVGLPLIAGFRTSPARVLMQIEGTAFKIGAQDLQDLLKDCPRLEKLLQRYSQEVAMQAAQVAACNRLHEVEERLARWLLMSRDRLGSNFLPTTQEFLSNMLGTRRASVTVAAGILQKAGLITYKRGEVTITNPRELKEAACECYEIMLRQTQSWQDEVK